MREKEGTLIFEHFKKTCGSRSSPAAGRSYMRRCLAPPSGAMPAATTYRRPDPPLKSPNQREPEKKNSRQHPPESPLIGSRPSFQSQIALFFCVLKGRRCRQIPWSSGVPIHAQLPRPRIRPCNPRKQKQALRSDANRYVMELRDVMPNQHVMPVADLVSFMPESHAGTFHCLP